MRSQTPDIIPHAIESKIANPSVRDLDANIVLDPKITYIFVVMSDEKIKIAEERPWITNPELIEIKQLVARQTMEEFLIKMEMEMEVDDKTRYEDFASELVTTSTTIDDTKKLAEKYNLLPMPNFASDFFHRFNKKGKFGHCSCLGVADKFNRRDVLTAGEIAFEQVGEKYKITFNMKSGRMLLRYDDKRLEQAVELIKTRLNIIIKNSPKLYEQDLQQLTIPHTPEEMWASLDTEIHRQEFGDPDKDYGKCCFAIELILRFVKSEFFKESHLHNIIKDELKKFSYESDPHKPKLLKKERKLTDGITVEKFVEDLLTLMNQLLEKHVTLNNLTEYTKIAIDTYKARFEGCEKFLREKFISRSVLGAPCTIFQSKHNDAGAGAENGATADDCKAAAAAFQGVKNY